MADPAGAAQRWGEVLGVAPDAGAQGGIPRLALDGAEVRFVDSGEGASEGIVEIALAVPESVRAGREQIDVGAARITLTALDGDGA